MKKKELIIKETKSITKPVRYTPSESKYLTQIASSLDMHVTAYIHDKSLSGNERNKYARRKMCKTLVETSKSIDDIYNAIAESNTGYIEINKILPSLEAAKKGCDSLW